MADGGVVTVYNQTIITDTNKNNSFSVKIGRAQMLRNGVIVEVLNPQQAKIAEQAGACAIVVTQPTPGISRMPDPSIIKSIKQSVSIPVIAKTRIGHFVEAQILESIGVDFIDENDLLSPADEENHINKHKFNVPFVCGSHGLGEALSRVREGAALIRTQGDAMGVGNISQTVKNVRSVMRDIRVLSNMDEDEVFTFAKKLGAPYDVVAQTKQMRRLPVVHFAAGGILTPADAALMMQLGCDGVFVGNEVFEGADAKKKVEGMVKAVMHFKDPRVLGGLMAELNVVNGD